MCRRQMDADYHFAAQFTADLIAMNHTDFIITSTFQEIAGTEVPHLKFAMLTVFSRTSTVPHTMRAVQGRHSVELEVSAALGSSKLGTLTPDRLQKRKACLLLKACGALTQP